MPKNISTVTLNAPIQKVWDALTMPEQVKLWQFGSDLITNWKVGSSIEFITEWQGTTFKQWDTILEIRHHELIRYSLFAPRPDLEDKPENYFIMNYILSSHNEKTVLNILQEDNRPNAMQEAPQGEENPILQSLKKLVEVD
jgi:uncharacterized protein YndB with AHSA1/START domain